MKWEQQQAKLAEALAKFPGEFGLRAYPGKRFMVNEAASYFSEAYGVLLYTFVWNGKWEAFAKGSPEELAREIVPLS